MSNDELARFRNRNVGFVFQFHHLLPEFTRRWRTWPCRAGSEESDRDEALRSAAALLAELGLRAAQPALSRTSSPAASSSGWPSPARCWPIRVLFLADEPTGNLDLETSERVFDLMRECHNKRGLTSVIVTHNPDLAARCDRVFEMKQSRIN